jgi:hypothetical protein
MVSEGDIFEGYETFFDPGNIKNNQGKIVDIYGLIVGTGNVTNLGSLAVISFTSNDVSGFSSIVLSNVGVTNETVYVPVTVDGGNVHVDAMSPGFDDNSPSQGYTGDDFVFNVSISDDTGSGDELTVYVDWSQGSKGGNDSMSWMGGSFFTKTVTLDPGSVSDLDYVFHAYDSLGNYGQSAPFSAPVLDNDPPTITSDSGDTGMETGETTTLWLQATDNIQVTQAKISIDGGTAITMTWANNQDRYEYDYTAPPGDDNDHTYTLTAYDAQDQTTTSGPYDIIVTDNDYPIITDITATPETQEINGYVNITAQVTDNIGINSVYLNIQYPDSTSENKSITSNNINNMYYDNETYGQAGTHYYYLWADDQSQNAVTSLTYTFTIIGNLPPLISNTQRTTSSILDTDPTFGWVNITCNVADNDQISQVYLNITNPDSSLNQLSMGSLGSNNYYVNTTTAFSKPGNYTYHIWSVDSDSNTANSITYNFSMPPNHDINKDGTINLLDLVYVSNHFSETGQPGWIREDVDNSGTIKVLDLVLVSNHYNETWI